MSTTNRTVEALENAQPHELLSAFVVRFNDLSGQLDEVSQERDELDIQVAAAATTQAALLARIADLEQENERCCDAARKAEKIGNQVGALLVEKTRLQEQLNQLQQVIATYGGVNGIDKLKEQNKRLKSGNTEKDARISQLERDNSKARHDLTTAQRHRIEAHTKIDLLQRQLAHDTGSGLYHNGEHHLIIWPQKTKMQRPDGSTFEARSLLYMHQSGRGALFTYSEDDGTVFAASPKPGLKPTKEVQEFAHNWLFKVNALQAGIVHDTDMVPVDFNGYASQQAA
ncbi:Chromosome partition protein Smc [compost metagenome]